MTIKLENEETALCVVRPEADVPPSQCRRRPESGRPPSEEVEGDLVLWSSALGAAVVVSSPCAETELSLEDCRLATVVQKSSECNLNILIDPINSYDREPPALCYSETDSEDGFVDDDSTVSTFSCSSSDDGQAKRVRFADPIVSEVKTRPRTPSEDLKVLFYSYEETQRFRQEYRLERKVLARTDTDPASVSVTQPLNDVSTLINRESEKYNVRRSNRHRISRVVVLHNDIMKTFYDDESDLTYKHTPQAFPCKLTDSIGSDDFFDNDSFWSGSITWF